MFLRFFMHTCALRCFYMGDIYFNKMHLSPLLIRTSVVPKLVRIITLVSMQINLCPGCS